jgi:serine/threonine protein kinase/Tfp pilus assembly protein PilF
MRKMVATGNKFFNRTADEQDPRQLLAQGIEQRSNNQLKEAEETFTKLIKNNLCLNEAYFQRSMIYAQSQQYPKALSDALRILEENHTAQYHSHYASLCYLANDYNVALEHYNQAIMLESTQAEYYTARALVQLDPSKAKNDFQKGLQLKPDDLIILHNFGLFLIKIKEFQNAADIFEKIMRISPTNVDAFAQSGFALQQLNFHERAIAYFDKALAINSNVSEVLNNKAVSLYKLKKIEESREHFKKAIAADNNNAQAYYNYSVLLKQYERYEEAVIAFSRAFSLMSQDAKKDKQNANSTTLLSIAQSSGDLLTSVGKFILPLGAASLQILTATVGIAANAAAPGAGAGVGVAVEIIGSTCQIAAAIYELIQQVNANKLQCKRLAERIIIVCNAIMGLENAQNYIFALGKLRETLVQAQKLVEQFTETHWLKKVLLAAIDHEAFENIYKSLKINMFDLNLALTAQQIVDAKQDKLDAAEDKEAIEKNFKTIITMNIELKEKLDQIYLNDREKDIIRDQQFRSMELALKQLLGQQPMNANKAESRVNIPFHELNILGKMNESKLETIYRGVYHDELVAIKEIVGLDADTRLAQFNREAAIMDNLRSVYFPLFYGVSGNGGVRYLVSEYMAKGSLTQFLASEKLNLKQRTKLSFSIISAVHALHQKKVYHRYLSTQAFGINELGEAKLMDFGLVKVHETIAKTAGREVKHSKSNLKIMSPERLLPFPYQEDKADIYSLGVILYEVMTSRILYQDLTDSQILQQVHSGKPVAIPKAVPDFYRELIIQCLLQDPTARPSTEELLTKLKNMPDAETFVALGEAAEKNQNFGKAEEHYRDAIFYGNIRARTNLATLMFQKKVEENERKEMRTLFKLSANEEHSRAMVNLAFLYQQGLDGKTNIPKSFFWLREAALANHPEAKQRLTKLEQQFPDEAAKKINCKKGAS